jgi:hypothetical protein
MKRLVLLLALAAPAAAAPQGLALRPPDVGESMRQMDRLRARSEPLAQTFVLPERPGQNQVNWFDFDWHHFDIPSPSGGRGGVRLYYYRREKASAERALPAIRNAYLRLVDQFHYTPTKQIPYILYSSKREFQTTNVFEVSESVLGVTSPRDLKMSLPYFGDHEKFREVSTHEMVHQFTIQKLLDIAGADEIRFIESLPLWFIEGIAEYYTKGGIDAETDRYLRDLVWNPDPERRYELVSFAEDRLRGYIPTYKLGQARVAFIAEVYGKEKIQALLENAYVAGGGAGSSERSFGALVRRVLNDTPEQVDARWRAWVKRRYYPEYMRVRQDLAQMKEYRELPAEPEAFVASPDGWVVFYRGIDREEGRVGLYLFDVRHPKGAVDVVSDNQPGVESLHPIEQQVIAITDGKLAFTAQAGATDALYVVPYKHEPPKEGRPPRLSVGRRKRLEVRHPEGLRFIEVSDPTFSADGSHIAFVGLTDRGQRDIYVVSARGGTARQVTDDAYAERDLAWGRDGIYCASDATDHGRLNIFRVDEATGQRTRLTTGAHDDRHPFPQADGSVLFSSDQAGKPDLHLLKDGKVRRISDFSTGLESPAPAPNARGILASAFYGGHFRLVEVPKVAWLEDPPVPVAAVPGPALEVPRESIPDDTPAYQAFAWRNWHPEGGYVFGGGGAGTVAGRAAMLFSDMLRDRLVFLDLSIYGSFNYTQALVLYEDRRSRFNWVLGAFHFVNQQLYQPDPNLTFYQRDFGVLGALRLPLDRFQRVELELQAGGTERYCPTDFTTNTLGFGQCGGISERRTVNGVAIDNVPWRDANAGITPSLSPSIRYGYDTVRLDPGTGPLSGSSLILELGGLWLPSREAVSGFARLDAATWFQILGRTNFMLRLAAGSSFAPDTNGRNWAKAWWLTSADNLRGFYPLDTAYLVGLNYYVANAELQLPLDSIIRFLFFDHLEAVAAFDFGGVFNQLDDRLACTVYAPASGGAPNPRDFCTILPGAWSSRTLTGVLGVNALLGPLLLRLHFGHPFEIGGQKTPAMLNGSRWVTNFTLRWFFF